MLGLISCVETVHLDLPEGNPRRVVFGWVTSLDSVPYVKLSWSNGFNDNQSYPLIHDAEVYVYSAGHRYAYVEREGTGMYYMTDTTFRAGVGYSYRLMVMTEGDTLFSQTEKMDALSTVDSSFVSFVVDPNAYQVKEEQDNYYISGLVDDDPSKRNYYRWKVYVNGELRNLPSELVLFDDILTINGTLRVDASNVLFKKGDSVSFEHMSLTEAAYNYYLSVQSQTNNDALEPTAKPGTVLGNVINVSSPNEQVHGYFGASDVQIVADVYWGIR
ncbi:hypothetical protein BFP72_06995 [Reichenbachiella sp. 5M10]|uniref:DUF4249 domain-containing protein n=1 Tax=Reichenbachiella sp. 5M10 TaxID=1889772 RepID=UPI000C44D92D|nr:DUF4249 domain-containing protein [Reichenbachiella sp. 5M10]PIB35161.1 hypothetical protein BFP72_06995 [Reichenbachiella sp. 5M10]